MSKVSVIIPFKAPTAQHVDWLIEALKSVERQTFQDWDVVLANDHSTADLTLLKRFLKTMPEGKVFTRTNRGKGVSEARNTAAYAATSELLMPLDADDVLPDDALERMVDAWDLEGHKHGIVYGNILMFGQDWQRAEVMADYDFNTLLNRLFMLVGSMHKKSDWKRVGGWKSAMEYGFEDWEYWISMGEIGVCGYHIPHITYHYRKHKLGRLATLRADKGSFAKATGLMRDLHRDTYAGRYGEMCCGKFRIAPKALPPASTAKFGLPAAATTLTGDMEVGRTRVIYRGRSKGSFFVTARPSGVQYKVNGPGNPLSIPGEGLGVKPEDVPFIRSLGRGKDFHVEPKPN
jgi:glycosyltransferase involved in cell wall biosynthesis